MPNRSLVLSERAAYMSKLVQKLEVRGQPVQRMTWFPFSCSWEPSEHCDLLSRFISLSSVQCVVNTS